MWAYLGIAENVRRNNLVGTESLPRVDEGSQNLTTLLALGYPHTATLASEARGVAHSMT